MAAQIFNLKHYPKADDASPLAPAAGTTPKKIPLSRLGHGIRIKNLEAPGGPDVRISFDGGRTFYPISPGEVLSEDVKFQFFFVLSSGAAASWAALVREG